MSIRKYGRYWAVYASDGALVCLTVYKKGATEVVRRLQQALDDAQQWQDANGHAQTWTRQQWPVTYSNHKPGRHRGCLPLYPRRYQVIQTNGQLYAAVYARVSTADQADKGYSLPTQQFPLITCKSYVTTASDSALSILTIRFCLWKRLPRSAITGDRVANDSSRDFGIAFPL